MSDIAQYLPGILLSLSAIALALLSPGPNVLAVIGTSMGIDRREGFALALGVSSGTCCWAILTVSGFTSAIVRYAELMFALKILGGCYLLWLGYKSLRSASSPRAVDTTELRLDGGLSAYFKRGLNVQMSNPKAAFAMIAIVSIGLQTDAPWWVGTSLIVGATLLSLIGHCAYAFASSTQAMVRAYTRCRRTIEGILGAFFVMMGVRLIGEKQ